MRPVVTVAEMGAIDREAQATTPVEGLIARAGAAVARAALALLGGSYGRRVVVVAGRGHNGDDGRVAAERLRDRGVRVAVFPAADAPEALPPCDLVIDAAYGTGFRGRYRAPSPPPGAAVLAVDIPSGVSGDTGIASNGAVHADATVTFAALKPGLLLADGPEHSGSVEVADIGLDCSRATIHVVEDSDVAPALPVRPRNAHKWQTALAVVAGSPGMLGSATFVSHAAMRAGSGMIRLGVPGASGAELPVSEVVSSGLPAEGWEDEAGRWAERCRALVVGPGLGRSDATRASVRAAVAAAAAPVLVDADGLHALGADGASITRGRDTPAVLTPHDGEFAVLAGERPADDRIASVRALAQRTGAVVLLKGSTTVVADPGGDALLAASGSPRLATAGTGDVLSGVIGAFLARGVEPLWAAALGAHVHGRAGALGPPTGLVAGDVVDQVAAALAAMGAT